MALQFVLLVFLRGWSKRVSWVLAQKFSFIKEQQWENGSPCCSARGEGNQRVSFQFLPVRLQLVRVRVTETGCFQGLYDN